MSIPTKTLKYGSPMPLVGLGTYLLAKENCQKIIEAAFEIGYRHIDTALLYENQHSIGLAIKNFRRSDLYLTSKVMPYHLDGRSIKENCERCLEELQVDYLDLFLMHWPDRKRDMNAIMEELAELVELNLTKAIGVSNFTTRHLEDMAHLNLPIAVNQVEFHPYLNQTQLLQYCLYKEIQVVSYRSLGQGKLTHDPVFETIAKRYNKTAAQICLRWLVQQGIPIIPKTTSTSHLKENCDLFDFILSDDDFYELSNLEHKSRFCDGADWADFNYI